MINSVLAAALGGAAGGAIGGLLGMGLQKLLKRPATAKASPLVIAVAIVPALIGAQVGGALNSPSLEQQIDSSNVALAAMHKYYPADYEKMVAMMKSENLRGDTADVHAKILPYLKNLITAHLKEVDEVQAKANFTLVVDELKVLRAKNADACVALMNGKPMTLDLASVFSPALQERDKANSAAILAQVATHPAAPAAPLPPEQLQQLATAALANLPKEQQDLITPLITAGRDPVSEAENQAMCDFDISLITDGLAAPPGTLRGIMAQP